MKNVLFGETKTVRASERAELEKLALKRTDPREVVGLDLARRASALAHRLGAQVAFLVGRDGRIVHVLLGSRDRLYLPDLGRFRLDSARLRRLRLVVFVAHAEKRLGEFLRDPSHLPLARSGEAGRRQVIEALPMPEDFLTDLEKLRLDAVLVVAVDEEGSPGPVTLAYLQPRSGRTPRGSAVYYGRGLADLSFDFQVFTEELESLLQTASPAQGFETKKDKAILVGAYNGSIEQAEASMVELVELARTAGIGIADRFVQRRPQLDPRTLIGKGKIEQLVLRSLEIGANLLVFDRELTPSQLRAITNITELRVIDRSMLILDIFAQRAQSSEGRLQVELAQLKYSLPRLTERDSGLSRLTGGIGGRGPGETKLEVSRRRVRDRIHDLEKRIEKLAQQREIRRGRRQERGVPVVAIVGYTNSGKSTLLNALTKSEVLVESKLFATLDPSSRRMRFPNEQEVVFVDTVGFIRELPRELVNAFRATLEEVGEADLLLHLVDASNPEMRQQIAVVVQTLESLGFGEKRRILALNKTDLLLEPEIRTLSGSLDALPLSAKERRGFEGLISAIQCELSGVFAGQDPGRFLAPGLQI